MPTRERPYDRGTRRGRALLDSLLADERLARELAGLSQAFVADAVKLSASEVSRIERRVLEDVGIVRLSQMLTVVGLELGARAYPASSPLRDAGHRALLGRLRSELSPLFRWRTEVPVDRPGDLRAWDAQLTGAGVTIGVEAETRPRDAQAIERRIALKLRDSLVDHVVLLVADTRGNRLVLPGLRAALAGSFGLDAKFVLAALREGRDPGGSAIVVL